MLKEVLKDKNLPNASSSLKHKEHIPSFLATQRAWNTCSHLNSQISSLLSNQVLKRYLQRLQFISFKVMPCVRWFSFM